MVLVLVFSLVSFLGFHGGREKEDGEGVVVRSGTLWLLYCAGITGVVDLVVVCTSLH